MDVSHKLPQLKRRPGVHTWKVFENYNKVYTSFSEVEPSTKLSESMFPQTTPLPLERCLRIYPHLQDTGGFFIAVIKKTKDFIFKRVESSTDEIAGNYTYIYYLLLLILFKILLRSIEPVHSVKILLSESQTIFVKIY